MVRATILGRRVARTATAVLLIALLGGCDWDAFSKWWEGTPDKHVRISGEAFFKLSKGDNQDGAYSQNGYLCVVHYPGCGIGEDGEDTFFAIKQLPPFATLENFEFEPIPPAGMDPDFSGGPAGDGSFGTLLQPGTQDGLATLRVNWHNACVGPYAGKAAVYRVSLKVKTKGDIDLGDTQYDQSRALAPPACRFDDPNQGGLPEVSGWSGSIYVCNPFDVANTLHLKATFDGSGSGSGATSLDENIDIRFVQEVGGSWSANFKTVQTYRTGNWNITSASLDGNFGAPANIPRTQALPGGVGEPLLDFRGGKCVAN